MTRLERFWLKVDRSGGVDACWPWTGAIDADGYGRFSRTGAHRVACMIAHGDPPADDSQACHSTQCPSRKCCNPKHVRWDSPAGNQHDVRITLTRRGEKNGKAKLTEPQVREVWARREEAGYVTLARRMDLPEKAVQHILNGRNWAYLTGATSAPRSKDRRHRLSDEDVRQIRSVGTDLEWGGRARLGKRYGVSGNQIGRILSGKRRRPVKPLALAVAIVKAAEAAS